MHNAYCICNLLIDVNRDAGTVDIDKDRKVYDLQGKLQIFTKMCIYMRLSNVLYFGRSHFIYHE